MLPEWIIGDSSDRMFVIHLHRPRFIAEVDEDDNIEVVEWWDTPEADAAALARLMREGGDFYLAEMDREGKETEDG